VEAPGQVPSLPPPLKSAPAYGENVYYSSQEDRRMRNRGELNVNWILIKLRRRSCASSINHNRWQTTQTHTTIGPDGVGLCYLPLACPPGARSAGAPRPFDL